MSPDLEWSRMALIWGRHFVARGCICAFSFVRGDLLDREPANDPFGLTAA